MSGTWNVAACLVSMLLVYCGQCGPIHSNTSHNHAAMGDVGLLTAVDYKKHAKESVIVSVARTNDFDDVGQVPYPELLINARDAWDPSKSAFTVPRKSTFFFHLNAGARPYQPVNLTLRGLPMRLSLDRGSASHTGLDTMSRDFIVTLRKGSYIDVHNDMDSLLYSRGGRQTSFSTFDIEAHMDSDTATVFRVARDAPGTSKGEVVYPVEFVNIGEAFDSHDHSRFQISRNGTYFFTLSLGVCNGMRVRVQILSESNPSSPLAELWRSSTAHNGTDVIRTGVMAELQEGDEVYTVLKDGEACSDGGHQIFFGGFLYDLACGINMAWSVWSDDLEQNSVDPLTFQGSWVNTYQIFDLESNTVTIIQNGIYFVSLSIGALPSNAFDASIVLERHRVEMNIYRTWDTVKKDTMSQGAILRLSEGNKLRVVLGEGSKSFSDGDHQTVFTGFLIHPE